MVPQEEEIGMNGVTLSWRRPLSYRNQSIVLQSKSIEWFLYDADFRHEKVKRDILGQQLHKKQVFFCELYEIFQNGFSQNVSG